jgi:ADP-ribose pyrophosphatase YjhB (NUDIX family)
MTAPAYPRLHTLVTTAIALVRGNAVQVVLEGNQFRFPQGAFLEDVDESFEDAAARALKLETGLTVAVPLQWLGSHVHRTGVQACFLGAYSQQADTMRSAAQWIALDTLRADPTLVIPAHRVLLDRLLAHLP